jgi:hypothetical protein
VAKINFPIFFIKKCFRAGRCLCVLVHPKNHLSSSNKSETPTPDFFEGGLLFFGP